jgi:hypothetical protein
MVLPEMKKWLPAADPVDYEEMAAKQHRCLETQRLLAGTSLKAVACAKALTFT